jgi:hypothetical protein
MPGAAVGRPKKIIPKGKAELDGKSVGFRVSGEYATWLEGLADHYRTTVAGLIDRALAEWSESEGYPKKPPRRVP